MRLIAAGHLPLAAPRQSPKCREVVPGRRYGAPPIAWAHALAITAGPDEPCAQLPIAGLPILPI